MSFGNSTRLLKEDLTWRLTAVLCSARKRSTISSRLGLVDTLLALLIVRGSNRDLGFDHIVVGPHASVGGVEKPDRR